MTNQKVQVVTPGTVPAALTFNSGGNAIKDEAGRSYQFDALNRLTKITYSSGATSNFAYNRASQRISIVEKNSSGTVTSTTLYLWEGSSIAETRSSTNNVLQRFFSQGEQDSGTAYFYTTDHLGSVRELISSTGSIVSRLNYDVYGRTTVVSGTTLPTFQYAGYLAHSASGLYLTQFRAMDAQTSRWVSRDPLGESGGMNLYGYCDNNPINNADPTGLYFKIVNEGFYDGSMVTGDGSFYTRDVRRDIDTLEKIPGIGPKVQWLDTNTDIMVYIYYSKTQSSNDGRQDNAFPFNNYTTPDHALHCAGSQIVYNPKNTLNFENYGAPEFAIARLAHELSHAYDTAHGLPRDEITASMSENDAITYEDEMEYQNSLNPPLTPLRTQYDNMPIPFPYHDPFPNPSSLQK